MMPYLPLRIALIVAALPPLGFGLCAVVDAKYVQRFIRTFSNATAEATPELNYLLKPLGIYQIAFAACLLLAACDPVRYRELITLGAAALMARGVQRLALTKGLQKMFQISATVNVGHCLYLFLIGAVLLVLRPAA